MALDSCRRRDPARREHLRSAEGLGGAGSAAALHPVPAPLVELPSTYSFPSGHATVSFACATVLALAVPRLRVPLFALAALISFSRVYVGVHYPFDVLAAPSSASGSL